ncbi:MAG: hypothetical protein GKS05_12840 [Nitrospirales bacterium]|nr:hypothetical protein [Nitrospirales bacterium]
MEEPEYPHEEGKRSGAHPIIVVFGIIIGLWLFIQFIIPDSKKVQPPQGTEKPLLQTMPEETNSALVPSFKVSASIPSMNALSLLVHESTTDSQILALLQHLRQARAKKILKTLIPPTNLENQLDPFSIADIYVFSDPQYGVSDAIRVLAIGAHAPGEFYSPTIPYEVAMEQVRGHYTINSNDKVNSERGSLGFGEEATGLYSKRYQLMF